jgi:hypothetical protein
VNTDFIHLGAGGNNNVSTGQGTTIVYAQNGKRDNIACHGNTTVYADRVDQTSNCTKVIFTPPPARDGHRSVRRHKTTTHRHGRTTRRN